jgi:hypothetical protein
VLPNRQAQLAVAYDQEGPFAEIGKRDCVRPDRFLDGHFAPESRPKTWLGRASDLPPIFSTIPLLVESPSPVPPKRRVVDTSS